MALGITNTFGLFCTANVDHVYNNYLSLLLFIDKNTPQVVNDAFIIWHTP